MVLLLGSGACPGGTRRPVRGTVRRRPLETRASKRRPRIDHIEWTARVPDDRTDGANGRRAASSREPVARWPATEDGTVHMGSSPVRAPALRHALGALLAVLVVGGLPGTAAAEPALRRLPTPLTDDGGATTVIVKYREGTSDARRRESRAHAHAARVRARPNRRREVVRPSGGQTIAETVRLLRADPAVEYAEPNYPVRFAATPATEPLRDPYQWGLENGGSGCVPGYEVACASDV